LWDLETCSKRELTDQKFRGSKPTPGISFSCSTPSVYTCHTTRRKHEGWDIARLPKPKHGKSKCGGRVRPPSGKPCFPSHLSPASTEWLFCSMSRCFPDRCTVFITLRLQVLLVVLVVDAHSFRPLILPSGLLQDFVFLGTASGYPSPDRGASGLVLRNLQNGDHWLFDCGEGTQIQAQRSSNVRLGRISNIFISHLHGDHMYGLPGLLCTIDQKGTAGDIALPSSSGSPSEAVVNIYGPQGLRRYLRLALALSRSHMNYTYAVHELILRDEHRPAGWEDWCYLEADPIRDPPLHCERPGRDIHADSDVNLVCRFPWNFSVKGRVYNAAVRSILLYGSETCPLRAEDVKRLSVFDHRCLRSIAGIWWEHRISNAEVRRMVFGRNNSPSIDELITLHRLRWLGHVLRMPVDRLPRRVLFAQPCEGWKRARGGQTMTWQRRMKAITSKLSCAGHCRLPGGGPRDGPHQWLETLSDMAHLVIDFDTVFSAEGCGITECLILATGMITLVGFWYNINRPDDMGISVHSMALSHTIPSLGWLIVHPPKPPALCVETARMLGVPDGPLMGQLKKGEPVVINGQTVYPAQVLKTAVRGHRIAIMGDSYDSSALERLLLRLADKRKISQPTLDVLVHEATLQDSMREEARTKGHSTPTPVVQLAAQLKARLLVLTHFSHRYTPVGRPNTTQGKWLIMRSLAMHLDETRGWSAKTPQTTHT
ncbi:hypothetical protein T265_12888, partial [Opisthorchis viverrini]